MLPVYFPFTSVSTGLMDASSRFFKKMAVYQMSAASIPERMKKWQADERLDIRLPWQHREKEILTMLKEFRTWARLHQGGDISFFKTLKGDIPFFDDSSVAQIRKQIKTGGEAKTASGKTDSSDLYPGVFLQMAQDLDEKNREIAGDLASQAAKEHALIKALKGDETIGMLDDSVTGTTPGDQEAYMIPERIAAWARILLADDRLTPLLVTSHPMVLDELVERALPGSHDIHSMPIVMAPKGDPGQISQCQDALAGFIEDISRLAWSGENGQPSLNWGCESAASGAGLSLYVIPGITPRSLLGRCLGAVDQTLCIEKEDENSYANTVVGILKP